MDKHELIQKLLDTQATCELVAEHYDMDIELNASMKTAYEALEEAIDYINNN